MRTSVIALAVLCGAAFGGTEVPLWPEGRIPSMQGNQCVPYLVWHSPKELKSTAILISVSGGGYRGNGINGSEVAPIRDYFLERGVTVVTMKYRVPRPQGMPKHVTAWQDAQRTVRLVRAEAAKRGLDPENIGFTGCSAGGHLALLVAVSSQTPAYEPVDEIDGLPCHVNWAVPVYPAYGLVPNAENCVVKECNDLSAPLVPEFKFDAKTPPMCLVHGDADGWSPMVSVRVYHKLRTMGIPAELHVMALEPHCFMVEPAPGTPACGWKDRVWEWAVKMDIVSGHPNSRVAPWRHLYVRDRVEDVFDAEPGAWERKGRRGEIAPKMDGAIWTKDEHGDFALDFEYKLDKGADLEVLIRGIEIQLRDASICGRCAPAKQTVRKAGEWNRMTVYACGSRVQIVCNGEKAIDADIPEWPDAAKAKIGFRGHGGAASFLRSIRIRPLGPVK